MTRRDDEPTSRIDPTSRDRKGAVCSRRESDVRITPSRSRLVFSMPIILVVLTCVARAQPALQPVDPAVGDLDLLSHNLRVVEPGLRSIGEQSNLFTLQPLIPGNSPAQTNLVPVYYRLAPGFRARVDRMEYIVPVDERTARRNVTPARDGFYLERFPANTLFELSPRIGLTSEPPSLPHALEFPTEHGGARAIAPSRSIVTEDAPPAVSNRVAASARARAEGAVSTPSTALVDKSFEIAMSRDPLDHYRPVLGTDGRIEYRRESRVQIQSDARINGRIDFQLDLRVNNRVDTRIDDRVDLRSPVRTNEMHE